MLESAESDLQNLPERSAEAYSDVRRSTTKVRCQRWPSPMGPVVGPSLIIADIGKIAESLAVSGFMRPWIVEQIKAHLLSGGEFLNKGQTKDDDEDALVPNGEASIVRPRSEYRLATEGEVLDFVDHVQFANVTGHRVSAKAQERILILRYHEGVALIQAYENLPRQAKVILDILNESGREQLTEASIEVLLVENEERLKTKQPAMRVWGFYRHRFIEEGHLEEAS
jgi:hypothetical protein